MATGIRTRQGKDLDDIFVRGAGDQVFGIKANTGEDIGKRFLNVDQGAVFPYDTGILSGGEDIRHKLCYGGSIGINWTIIGETHTATVVRSALVGTLLIQVAGVPSNKSVLLSGTVSFWYASYGREYTKVGTITNAALASGKYAVASVDWGSSRVSGYPYGAPPLTGWFASVIGFDPGNNVSYSGISHWDLSLSYGYKTVKIPFTTPSAYSVSYSGSF